MPFKPADKAKSVTLEDMFRKQKLKQNAPVVKDEPLDIGLQELA